MQKVVGRSIISGRLAAPPSLALAHRALFVSSLAQGQSLIGGIFENSEMLSTAAAMRSVGADIVLADGEADVFGAPEIALPPILDCGNSNTTLKLMMPLAASFDGQTALSGSGRLAQKPLAPFQWYLRECGASAETSEGKLPMAISGPMNKEKFAFFPEFGSQFLSGLLLSAPLRENDTQMFFDAPLPRKWIFDSTIELMQSCGIEIITDDEGNLSIFGGQEYSPLEDFTVPRSARLASFLLLAGAAAGSVEVEGVDYPEFNALLEKFGAHAQSGGGKSSASVGALRASEIDAAAAGELLPHAIVLAALSEGETKFSNFHSAHPRILSCCRIIIRELAKMGVRKTETESGLFLSGGRLEGAELDVSGNADAAMALSIAALAAGRSATISGAECVDAVYPGFFRDLALLGALVR